MTEAIQHLLSALTDNTIAFYKKVLTLFLVLFVAFAVNDLFSLSFNHRVDKRIAQLESLSKLAPADSALWRRDAVSTAAQIRGHKPVLVQAERLVVSLAANRLSAAQQVFWWKLLSAAGLFLLALIATPMVEKDAQERNLVLAGLLVLGAPIVCLLMLIPTFPYPWINYVLNIAVVGGLGLWAHLHEDQDVEEEQPV